MVTIPELPLLSTENGTIPSLGLGTAAWPFAASENMKESILHAIKLGYRHFDSAAIYNSESTLSEAISVALQLGLVESREQLFITSKLWCTDAHAPRVVSALRNSLTRLGLDYIDLYLIHQPVSLKSEGYDVPFRPEDLVPLDFKSVWEAMEECQSIGLAKNIGVSNFSCKKLEQLLVTAKIPPAVNQVEMSPLWQQGKLRAFCKEKGIHITAYSTLGARGTAWGSNLVLDCEVLKEIAKVKGKTVAQVCLRWVHEQGVSVVVKSFNKARLEENMEIFDWELSKEECDKIEQIPQRRLVGGLAYVSEQGPYKTEEEFWDGVI